MASALRTRFKFGPYLRNEHGIKQFAEMSLGQLIRKVAAKARFYREMNENLLVEKANLRMRQVEMADQPMLEPGAFFVMRRRLWANQALIVAALVAAVVMAFVSLTAFLSAATDKSGALNWVLAAIFACVLVGGGIVVTERLTESLLPRMNPAQYESDEAPTNPKGLLFLWLFMLAGLLFAVFGLATVRANMLETQTQSNMLYLGFLVLALMLPLVAGALRWDSMRFVDLYKTTQNHREVDARLAQIDSILRQNEEFENNFYKVRLLTHWDDVSQFRIIKENYNVRKGYAENLTGHFAGAFDLFQAEAARRYESDLRDLTARSLRRLDSTENSTGQVGGKLGQTFPQPESATIADAMLNEVPEMDEDVNSLYLAPKPVH